MMMKTIVTVMTIIKMIFRVCWFDNIISVWTMAIILVKITSCPSQWQQHQVYAKWTSGEHSSSICCIFLLDKAPRLCISIVIWILSIWYYLSAQPIQYKILRRQCCLFFASKIVEASTTSPCPVDFMEKGLGKCVQWLDIVCFPTDWRSLKMKTMFRATLWYLQMNFSRLT